MATRNEPDSPFDRGDATDAVVFPDGSRSDGEPTEAEEKPEVGLSKDLRRIGAFWIKVAEILAALESGGQDVLAVRDEYDQCTAECIAGIEDSGLRDSLDQESQILRQRAFRTHDVIRATMGPMTVGEPRPKSS